MFNIVLAFNVLNIFEDGQHSCSIAVNISLVGKSCPSCMYNTENHIGIALHLSYCMSKMKTYSIKKENGMNRNALK